MNSSEGPLKGVKVLDLATAIAAPFASGMMADQGADVIKVEAPGIGDVMRYVGSSRNGVTAMFQMANRGKRGLAIDLKKAQGLAIFKKLVADTDVVIHNFRVGVVERLGISYEDLKAINPNLIYVSLYGFGHNGPDAKRRAYDNVVQAFSGVAYNQANIETGEPVQCYQAIADKMASMNVSLAVSSALFARASGRGGQHIRMNMVDSMVHFLWMDASETATFLEDGAHLGAQVAKGVPLMKFANGYGQSAPVSDDEFHGLCAAFNVDSTSEPKVATMMDRAVNGDAMVAMMQKVYANAATMDVDEAVAAMVANDVPCSKAMDIKDLPEHPQIIANGTFVTSEHAVAGKIREPRMAPEFEGTPAGVGCGSPSLGEHSDAILIELGLESEIAAHCVQIMLLLNKLTRVFEMKKILISILVSFTLVACGGSAGDADQRVMPASMAEDTRAQHRKLAMDGADNFRDLGGYQTKDGKTVKWGVLYRSDSLAELSDQDLLFIQRLGVKQIVDFRTPFEKEEDPDRIPDGVKYVEREIDVDGTAVKELFEKISSGDIDDLNAVELMENANRAFVTSQQGVYGPHLKSLLSDENNLPSVAHCTGGKDRAGFGAAITLLALGVPEHTVVQDFMLTNEYTKDKINKYIWMIRLGSFFQTDPEKIRPSIRC